MVFGSDIKHPDGPPSSIVDDTELPPPAYGASTRTLPLPPYPSELPPDFPIGTKKTKPLVTLREVECHLRLLAVFDDLRKTVIAYGPEEAPVEPNHKWALFLARAVHRFDTWCNLVVKNRTNLEWFDDELPPWDVAMVWHTYLLVSTFVHLTFDFNADRVSGACSNPTDQNPRIYYEDGIRINSQLLGTGWVTDSRVDDAPSYENYF